MQIKFSSRSSSPYSPSTLAAMKGAVPASLDSFSSIAKQEDNLVMSEPKARPCRYKEAHRTMKKNGKPSLLGDIGRIGALAGAAVGLGAGALFAAPIVIGAGASVVSTVGTTVTAVVGAVGGAVAGCFAAAPVLTVGAMVVGAVLMAGPGSMAVMLLCAKR